MLFIFLSPCSTFMREVTWSWPRHNDNFNAEKIFFSTNDFWTTGHPRAKKEEEYKHTNLTDFILFTITNSKYTIDLKS